VKTIGFISQMCRTPRCS